MAESRTGLLQGNTITLDEVVPPLEGKRVRVVLDLAEESEIVLTKAAQAELWRAWAEKGPQGPIGLDA